MTFCYIANTASSNDIVLIQLWRLAKGLGVDTSIILLFVSKISNKMSSEKGAKIFKTKVSILFLLSTFCFQLFSQT